MPIPRRALLFALGGVLFTLACNLTTTPPTPTASPLTPTPAITSLAPTLFASITPLAGFGGTQPTAIPTSACAPPSGWVPYTIQDGDYLAGLADATGTSVQAIVQANCLPDANTIYTGEVIYLPQSPVSG